MFLYQNPPDGGMLYAETNLQHLFPEPLNTITSCFFLAIAIFWTIKLKGKARQHTFLSVAVAFLYIGGIGGTIYHGLRQWHFFIMMDWLPIMLLCVAAGVYFLGRVTKWYNAVLLVALYICFQVFARTQLDNSGDIQLFININYAVLACMVLFPVLAFLYTTGFKDGRWVGFALLSFLAALLFRVSDGLYFLQSGTHFLWHTFGAIACFCMFQYIYLVNKQHLEPTL
jgi:hemolysin III